MSFPEFDRLSYDSLDTIHNDWFGVNDSPYTVYGGIKTVYNNKEWRKSLGNEASKREADKKMLQKMKRIGDYMEQRQNNGETAEQVLQHLRDLIAKSTKTKETLTGSGRRAVT